MMKKAGQKVFRAVKRGLIQCAEEWVREEWHEERLSAEARKALKSLKDAIRKAKV